MRLVISPIKTRQPGHGSRGQAMVEFAMVFMMFITLVVSIIEFAFLFTSNLSITYASHDAAQLAAEYGNTAGVDCATLERIDNDVSAPANARQIVSVDIYWVNTATPDAAPVGGAENIYIWDGGNHACTKPDGTTINIPFPIPTLQSAEAAAGGYPENTRCNANSGINCPNTGGIVHSTVDTIGVKIVYQYKWISPFPSIISNSTAGPLLSSTNIMRLEPVL
jgi:hypothetical protein